MRSTIVAGWGAVEAEAKRWHPNANAIEFAPRAWAVLVDQGCIGLIGKEPYTAQGVAHEWHELIVHDGGKAYIRNVPVSVLAGLLATDNHVEVLGSHPSLTLADLARVEQYQRDCGLWP